MGEGLRIKASRTREVTQEVTSGVMRLCHLSRTERWNGQDLMIQVHTSICYLLDAFGYSEDEAEQQPTDNPLHLGPFLTATKTVQYET